MSNGVDRPVLIIHEGEKAGQRCTIGKDEVVIGRGGECDLVLPERQVSREHIRIFRDRDVYYLEDLDSKNGTWVNGRQIKNTSLPLKDGDEIQIALAVKITFVGSEATAPLLMEWFRQSFPSRSPDRLYAFSNVGSLLALVCYPFVLEPLLTRRALEWF